LITKKDIENNKAYQFLGEFSRENLEIIFNWISDNIEIKSHARRIYGIIHDIYDSFLFTDEPFDIILSKEKNQYYIYISTNTPHSVAIFLNKIITTKLNLRSLHQRKKDFIRFFKREQRLLSGRTTALKRIIWGFYDVGHKINDQIQFKYFDINSGKSKIEIIIPMNMNRMWEFRLCYLTLNLNKEIF
jgi:hypothetical protein